MPQFGLDYQIEKISGYLEEMKYQSILLEICQEIVEDVEGDLASKISVLIESYLASFKCDLDELNAAASELKRLTRKIPPGK